MTNISPQRHKVNGAARENALGHEDTKEIKENLSYFVPLCLCGLF